MLYDRLDCLASPFLPLHPVFARALGWVQAFDPRSPDGIYELEGRQLFVNVQTYRTKPLAECRWESHRATTDIQCCLDGGEIVRSQPLLDREPSRPYEPDQDAFRWDDPGEECQSVRLSAGRFALFLAGEPHQPMIHDGRHDFVRKAVVKLSSSLL